MVEYDQGQYLIQDRLNMTGQPRRPPGHPKSGGAKKSSIKMNTRRVKDTIRQVFYDDLGGENYLRKVAKNDHALFSSLLAKLIPREVRAEVDVNVRQLNLGLAMREANARLSQIQTIDALPNVLEPNPIPLPK